ncbi:MAG TPA: hypothetical protein QF353_00025 [Gammaproteobacteria bacterium]|nr:hypothetical protein [Gammaproteobacteria bacterium]
MHIILSVGLVFLTAGVLAAKPLMDIKPFFMTPKGFGLATTSMPLTKVLHQYAKACDKSIYLDAKVTGTVKARIRDASCEDLLRYFIQVHGLKALRLGEGFQIIPAAKAPKKTKEVQLKYLFASDVVKGLKKTLSKSTKVVVKNKTTLEVSATEPALIRAERLIKHLDNTKLQAIVQVLVSSRDSENIEGEGVLWPNSFPLKVPLDINELKLSMESYVKQGKGRIISSPSLLMISKKPATFEVIDELPFEQTDGFGGQFTVYKKAKFSITLSVALFQGYAEIHYKLRHDRAWMQTHAPGIHSSTSFHDFRVPYGQTIMVAKWLQKHDHRGKRCLAFARHFKHIKSLFCSKKNKIKYETVRVYMKVDPQES